MELINTQNDIYLVQFQNTVYSDIVIWENLQESLKKLNNGYYLKNISRFSPSKNKFERVPNKMFNQLFGSNTEAIQILEKFNLIK